MINIKRTQSVLVEARQHGNYFQKFSQFLLESMLFFNNCPEDKFTSTAMVSQVC